MTGLTWWALSVGAPGTHRARFRGVLVRGCSVEGDAAFAATAFFALSVMFIFHLTLQVQARTTEYFANLYERTEKV